MDMDAIQEKLFALQDLNYRQFQAKLMPTVDPEQIIGVRMPALRKLAKEYGFDELYLRARFGNGAALYGQVEDTNRSRLLQAVAPRR